MNRIVETEGTLHFVGEVETYKSDFRKRRVVVSGRSGERTDYLAVNLLKEGVDLATPLDVGRKVKLKYAIGSREYQGKWYTDLDALSFELEGSKNEPIKTSSESKEKFRTSISTSLTDKEEDSDLPF
jgi:hypothetical protein